MSTFDSTKTQLSRLLDEVVEGKIQLPDFQRGWVWDDEHIRSLLVSIARSFPIGAVMLLETGGDAKFQERLIEGVEVASSGGVPIRAEQLILDGQQRLTSLTQVLKSKSPVATRDVKKRELRLHYYFDIENALQGPEHLVDAIVAVDEKKMLRSDFGRRIDLDLSTVDQEIAAFHFPCAQILDSSEWEYALMGAGKERVPRFMEFRRRVLDAFRNYMLPVIELKKQTSKEAVCLVFEKVNTGGVQLSVFELITASWAADGFNLREDWLGAPARGGKAAKPGRHATLAKRALLRDVQPTDFLQAVSLLHSFERRETDRQNGRTGKDVAAVTAKREHILEMPRAAYEKWSERLTAGFLEADKFLRGEGFHSPKFLPYRSQVVPLAAVLTWIGNRWQTPVVKDKLARWFWSGVLGELYGGAIETRIALDFQQLVAWFDEAGAPEPGTVQGAGFQPNRLDTLRSRTSAAYRGIYVLIQREGAKDFFWKRRMVDIDRDEEAIDIHHIFPQKWCGSQGIAKRTYDAIVNKTAVAYKVNRMIGGKAPSVYLAQIQKHDLVKLGDAAMDDILRTHLIDHAALRADDFHGFYAARKQALLVLITGAMGKAVDEVPEAVAEDDDDEEEEEAVGTPHEEGPSANQ